MELETANVNHGLHWGQTDEYRGLHTPHVQSRILHRGDDITHMITRVVNSITMPSDEDSLIPWLGTEMAKILVKHLEQMADLHDRLYELRNGNQQMRS
jgi:hypothetical protein